MKLEAGMYLKTKDGIIDKVIDDYKGCCNSPHCNCKHVSCEHNYYDEENISKASRSIIDLIEVGDYVNGLYVYSVVEENKKTSRPRAIFTEEGSVLGNDEIESIVTKEQFASMSYKVGVKDDKRRFL